MEATVEGSPALPSPSVPSGTRGARPGPMARHERLEEDVNRTEEAELRRMETNAEMEMMETDATAGDAEGEGCQGAAEAEEEVEEVWGGGPHNPTPLRRRDSTTLHTKSPDKPRECKREPRGWVRSTTNSPGTTVS